MGLCRAARGCSGYRSAAAPHSSLGWNGLDRVGDMSAISRQSPCHVPPVRQRTLGRPAPAHRAALHTQSHPQMHVAPCHWSRARSTSRSARDSRRVRSFESPRRPLPASCRRIVQTEDDVVRIDLAPARLQTQRVCAAHHGTPLQVEMFGRRVRQRQKRQSAEKLGRRHGSPAWKIQRYGHRSPAVSNTMNIKLASLTSLDTMDTVLYPAQFWIRWIRIQHVGTTGRVNHTNFLAPPAGSSLTSPLLVRLDRGRPTWPTTTPRSAGASLALGGGAACCPRA